MYVWYVQAIDAFDHGTWSEGGIFKVDIPFNLDGLEKNVREKLERQGLREEVIGEVLEDVSTGVKEIFLWGVDTAGINDNSLKNIGIQGNEVGSNTYYGQYSGFSLSSGTGTNNTFMGQYAGCGTTDGSDNTFMGYNAGYQNSTGKDNTFLGRSAGYWNNADDNTFIGNEAGNQNSTGIANTFVGQSAGYWNDSSCNTFIGNEAGTQTRSGYCNTFLGTRAGYNNRSGVGNTYLGDHTGEENEDGDQNTFVGASVGIYNIHGSGNVCLGYQAGYYETGSNRLYIENSNTSSPLIWGDFSSNILTVHGQLGIGTKSPAYQMEVETTGENAILLLDRTDGAMTGFSASGDKCAFGTLTNHPLWMVINGAFSTIFHTDGSLQMMNGAWCTAAGKWQDASSRELKENIRSLTVEEAEEALEGLEPVRFNYKTAKEDESLGFIAEDVPELVASKDKKSMSAMDVVAVLTKVVQEQQQTIGALQKEIEDLKKKNK
jgi:hypothetical protein